jgi:chorismate synthase
VPPVVEAATALVLADLMMLEGMIGRRFNEHTKASFI